MQLVLKAVVTVQYNAGSQSGYRFYDMNILYNSVVCVVAAWLSGNGFSHINEVRIRFNSRCGTFISVYDQPRATQVNSAWPSLRG